MSNPKYLTEVAGQLYLIYSDGYKQLLHPATVGTWLPVKDSRGPVDPPDPVDPVDPPETGTGWVHPLPGGSISSGYGDRGGVLHAGVDISSVGGTGPGGMIRATTAMRITVAREAGTGGLADAGTYVKGHTIHGTPYTFSHFHGHPGTLKVQVGQVVDVGAELMQEGNSGNSFGSHLHLEIWPGHVGPASVSGIGDGPWFYGDGTPPNPVPILTANGVIL